MAIESHLRISSMTVANTQRAEMLRYSEYLRGLILWLFLAHLALCVSRKSSNMKQKLLYLQYTCIYGTIKTRGRNILSILCSYLLALYSQVSVLGNDVRLLISFSLIDREAITYCSHNLCTTDFIIWILVSCRPDVVIDSHNTRLIYTSL